MWKFQKCFMGFMQVFMYSSFHVFYDHEIIRHQQVSSADNNISTFYFVITSNTLTSKS